MSNTKRNVQRNEFHNWIMKQKWEDLLFIHLPIKKEAVKAHIPRELELDTFDGTAWISIVVFRVGHLRLKYLPTVPFFRSFLEMNIRTYVKRANVSGVYFFSLDANHLPAVVGARLFSLPYYFAGITLEKSLESIRFASRRDRNTEFTCHYKPLKDQFVPESESLDEWLMERYQLWTFLHDRLVWGEIHHPPWILQEVDVTFTNR